MFKAVLTEPELLTRSISSIGEIIDEGIFKLSKDGISLRAADRAMVAAVDFKISSQAFEKYELDKEQSIGLNLGNLLSILKRAGAKDKLSFILANAKLQIKIQNSSVRRFYVPILDLSEEEVPAIEQLDEFAANVKVKPDVLESGIADAEIVADSIIFQASPNKFQMIAEGDISRAELELEKGKEALIDLRVSREVKTRYPLDYLKKMMKAAKISDSISMQFAQDYPLKLEFKSGEKVRVTYILAPRVIEE
jgi:proliferating cell nuclear antigen